MWMRRAAGRIRQNNGRSGSEILITIAQVDCVGRREIVNESKPIGGRKLHQAHGIIIRRGDVAATIERAITGLEIHVSLGIHGRSPTTVPETTFVSVGRGIVYADL